MEAESAEYNVQVQKSEENMFSFEMSKVDRLINSSIKGYLDVDDNGKVYSISCKIIAWKAFIQFDLNESKFIGYLFISYLFSIIAIE